MRNAMHTSIAMQSRHCFLQKCEKLNAIPKELYLNDWQVKKTAIFCHLTTLMKV